MVSRLAFTLVKMEADASAVSDRVRRGGHPVAEDVTEDRLARYKNLYMH